MNGLSRPLMLALAAGVLACGTPAGSRLPPAAPPPVASVAATPPPGAAAPATSVAPGLSFTVDPPASELLIDGRSLGKVSELAGGFVQLPPGLYQVSLKHAGFNTWRAEVAVRTGVEVLRVTLPKKP